MSNTKLQLNKMILDYFSKEYPVINHVVHVKNNNDFGTPYYQQWARLFINSTVDTIIFPDDFSKDIEHLPAHIRKVYLGKNFGGEISEKYLPERLIVYYPDEHPRVDKVLAEKQIRYIPLNPETKAKRVRLHQNGLNQGLKSNEYQDTRQKIALLLERRGIKAEFDPVRNKLIVEITNTNKDPSEFYTKMMFVSNKKHTNRLILVDNERAIESFPREFLFGPHTTSVAMYLGAFNSTIPAFRNVTKKIDLNLPELQTALPSLPDSLQIFRLNSRKYNVPLEKFPEGLRVLHLRLKKYDKAIPVYPANLEELTLELQSYRQDYPVLPAGLRKFHLRNMQEAGERRNFNHVGNLMNRRRLENFGEMVTYFPSGLDEVELPDNYRYALPEDFLDRIVDGSIKKVRIYGTSNRETIVLLSKEKLYKIIKEISEDEKMIYDTTGDFNQDIHIKYKRIIEMYKNIEVDINEYQIIFTGKINKKYIDYEFFDVLLRPNLSFNYESFNMDLSDFKKVESFDIRSDAFNQQIPQLGLLRNLRIDSKVFNHPIPQLNSLRFLHIKSEAFNQEIPQLNRLWNLIIESASFSQQIPELNRLMKLKIESLAFNQQIPQLDSLRNLEITSAVFNQPIPQLDSLTILEIESKVFNHAIPQLDSLTNLGIESAAFNQEIPKLNSLIELSIYSETFNQQIPELDSLEMLIIKSETLSKVLEGYIESGAFNKPIPKLDSLSILDIESGAFNQPIPQLNSLTNLVIKSKVYNHPIPLLNKIEKIMIVSSIFNERIPAELPELKKLYIVSPQFSPYLIPEFNHSVKLYIEPHTDNLKELFDDFDDLNE